MSKTFRHCLLERKFSDIVKQASTVNQLGIHASRYDFGDIFSTTGNCKSMKCKLFPKQSSVVVGVKGSKNLDRKKNVANKVYRELVKCLAKRKLFLKQA